MPLLLPAKKVFKSPYGIILRSMLRCTKSVLYTEIQSFLAGALHYAVAFSMLVMPWEIVVMQIFLTSLDVTLAVN